MQASTRSTCCGADKHARLAYTRRTVPAHSVAAPAPYIHTSRHTHSHTHTGNMRNTCARACCTFILRSFATNQQHVQSQRQGAQSPRAKTNNAYLRVKVHTYSPRAEDINAMHAYGRSSTPIAQGLVYDINALYAFWLRESQRTYGSVSTPIAQGLVEIINAKGEKMVMSPKAQGFVSNMKKNACLSVALMVV